MFRTLSCCQRTASSSSEWLKKNVNCREYKVIDQLLRSIFHPIKFCSKTALAAINLCIFSASGSMFDTFETMPFIKRKFNWISISSYSSLVVWHFSRLFYSHKLDQVKDENTRKLLWLFLFLLFFFIIILRPITSVLIVNACVPLLKNEQCFHIEYSSEIDVLDSIVCVSLMEAKVSINFLHLKQAKYVWTNIQRAHAFLFFFPVFKVSIHKAEKKQDTNKKSQFVNLF